MKTIIIICCWVFASVNVFGQNARSLAWSTGFCHSDSLGIATTYRPASFNQVIFTTNKTITLNLPEETPKKRSSIGRGAWMGTLIGLGAGVITGLLMGNDSCYPNCIGPTNGSTGSNVLIMGTLGALSGLVVGTIIGAISKH